MGYSLSASADNCYKGTTCLINKFDIRDEKLLAETEADITFMKSVMLDNNPIAGCFDFEHYKAIHRFLFCDIYYTAHSFIYSLIFHIHLFQIERLQRKENQNQ